MYTVNCNKHTANRKSQYLERFLGHLFHCKTAIFSEELHMKGKINDDERTEYSDGTFW